jgi:hypothetical protein
MPIHYGYPKQNVKEKNLYEERKGKERKLYILRN